MLFKVFEGLWSYMGTLDAPQHVLNKTSWNGHTNVLSSQGPFSFSGKPYQD
jgi:hypothetical protein